MSSYKIAIDRTVRVLEVRARYFRNLVVVVVLISMISLLAALLAHSYFELLSVFFVVPACGFFFFADSTLLRGWRVELVTSWVQRELDFAAFCSALQANPLLSKETLEGMLETLPAAGEVAEEQRIAMPTRAAIAAVTQAVHQRGSQCILIHAVASAVVVSSCTTAVWMHTLTPLFGIGALCLLRAAQTYVQRRCENQRDARLDELRRSPEFNESDYLRVVAALE